MSRHISIEVETSSDRYGGGDTICGQIRVSVDQDWECNALRVDLIWGTNGSGNQTGESIVGLVIFRGNWSAGQETLHPFEVTVPNGPYSYHGHYMNIDWRLRAVAEVPGTDHPTHEKEFLLGPGPKANLTDYLSVFDDVYDVEGRREFQRRLDGEAPFLFTLVFAAPLIFFGQYMIRGGIAQADGISPLVLIKVSIGAIAAFVGFGMLYRWLVDRLVALKLGRIRVVWPSAVIHLGDTIPLTLHLDAASGINAVTAILIRREVVDSVIEHELTTFSEDVFSAPIQMQRVSETGKRVTMEGTFRISEDDSPSFYASNHELSWLIAVHIDVAKWPDWSREFYLDVRPGGVVVESAGPTLLQGEMAVEDVVVNQYENSEAW